MAPIQALILGIVEGITEFLPVSSTGHLILASKILRIPQTEFLKSFQIAIQLGAILAVIVLYRGKIFSNWKLAKKVALAFVPTAIIGLVSYKFVKTFLLGNESVVLWSLLLGGIFLIAFEYFQNGAMSGKEMENISNKQALAIGVFQSIAIIPGVSRSAATIVGGLILGLQRSTIVEFSFLLAIPTMAAATSLDLVKSSSSMAGPEWILFGIGFGVSFITGMAAIKFFISFIKHHSFAWFGWYRVTAALFGFWIL